MPGYNDSKRLQSDSVRAQTLVQEAKQLVQANWRSQSWTEVGYSVISAGGSALKWTAGIGLKMSINAASAGIFGTIGESLLARATQSGYGPDTLAQKIGTAAVQHIWPLIEDQIKGGAESATTAVASAQTAPSRGTTRASGAGRAGQTGEELAKLVEDLKTKTSELMLRSYALRGALAKGTVPYCDNVHYMAVEAAQITALKADVLAAATSLKGFAARIEQLANGVDASRLDREIHSIAGKAVTKASGVPHYNSYSWNVIGRTQECSEAHCFGPHTTQL